MFLFKNIRKIEKYIKKKTETGESGLIIYINNKIDWYIFLIV